MVPMVSRPTQARPGPGDLEADLMSRVYDEHGPALFAFAMRFLHDEGRAADLVQEVLLRAWRNPTVLHPDTGSPRAWLFTVARNILTDWYRATSSRPESLVQQHALPDLAGMDDELDRMLVAGQMSDALARLSGAQRSVLEALYYQGRSTDEAARSLGIPPGTVKSRAHHALRHLRAIMNEMGIRP
jgi:RNA polymerase sigma-70 factor (ECF subfamily)